MPQLEIYRKSKVCYMTPNKLFGIVVAVLLLTTCEKSPPSEEATPEHPSDIAPCLPLALDCTLAVDRDDDGIPEEDGDDKVSLGLAASATPVSNSIHQDLVVQQHALVKQQAEVTHQATRASNDIAEIRKTLIARRLQALDDRADACGWAEQAVPEKHPDWKSYAEWKYLHQNMKTLQQGSGTAIQVPPSTAPAPMLLPIPRPKALPKPDWAL